MEPGKRLGMEYGDGIDPLWEKLWKEQKFPGHAIDCWYFWG